MLLLVGMTTVFVVLSLVVVTGNSIIWFANKYLPEEIKKKAAPPVAKKVEVDRSAQIDEAKQMIAEVQEKFEQTQSTVEQFVAEIQEKFLKTQTTVEQIVAHIQSKGIGGTSEGSSIFSKIPANKLAAIVAAVEAVTMGQGQVTSVQAVSYENSDSRNRKKIAAIVAAVERLTGGQGSVTQIIKA